MTIRRSLRRGLLIILSVAAVAPWGAATRAQPASDADASNGGQPIPVEEVVFDNWNVDACAFTSESKFALEQPTRVASVELWYNWRKSETALAFELLSGGKALARGTLIRGSCDPYQATWCEAKASLDIDAAPGDYSVRVSRGRLCKNAGSQDNGFVRIKGQRQPAHVE